MINKKTTVVVNALFGTIVFAIGVLFVVFVHPVPGIVCLLLSLVYVPATNTFLHKKLRVSIPVVAKILLAVIVIWFTLGVSDLGDMLDKAGSGSGLSGGQSR